MTNKVDAAPARRVLIVEDDENTADLLSRLMNHAGHGVRTAATVADALAYLRAEVPTHILLDLMLPDASGAVLLRAVRRQKLRVRVALVTAAGRGSDVVASAVLENPDAVFHKPVELAALEAWVAAAPDSAEMSSAARERRLLVEIDLAVLAAHLAEETGEPVGDNDVRQWLQDAGFGPLGERWLVAEAELGQLDPSEVRSVSDG
jgi:DNA-binding response OmpR family regulator